jgi:3-methyladenine DNA glycosylase AlkD
MVCKEASNVARKPAGAPTGIEMLAEARMALRNAADPKKARDLTWFFKYPEDDVFVGVRVPVIRRIAKGYIELPLRQLESLMKSRVHEERTLAHAILRGKYVKSNERERGRLFKYYLRNRRAIRAWDGVDDSAPYIVGAWLLHRDKSLLHRLARSKRIWDRRIAIVTTLWFIRNGVTAPTFQIAETLLDDREDLIHKAAGWMLREAGKRDLAGLKEFLRKHRLSMPRTMLRYAIERFPENERQSYLKR